MREITPALALRATEAADPRYRLGIQVGESVGHSRPPRVYLSHYEFPNAGTGGVVTKIMEAGGIAEAWEFPESGDLVERLSEQAAECTQDFLDGFNPDDDGTLFLAGNEEMAADVIDQINVPGEIIIKINEDGPEYIPTPTS